MTKIQGIFLLWVITMSLLLILPKFISEKSIWREVVKFLVFIGGMFCIFCIKFVIK
jgi:hypothetical protein